MIFSRIDLTVTNICDRILSCNKLYLSSNCHKLTDTQQTWGRIAFQNNCYVWSVSNGWCEQDNRCSNQMQMKAELVQWFIHKDQMQNGRSMSGNCRADEWGENGCVWKSVLEGEQHLPARRWVTSSYPTLDVRILLVQLLQQRISCTKQLVI